MINKVRLHEISKVLEIPNKEIIALLNKFCAKPKNHMSTLQNNELDIIFDYFTQLYSVEKFDFIEEKQNIQEKKEKKEKKKQDKQPEELDLSDMKITVKRSARYVDTRTTSVDLERFDTEKIEELLPENIIEQTTKKQKIKKGAKRAKREKPIASTQVQKGKKEKEEISEIEIPDEITVGDLAKKINQPSSEVIKKLMLLGIMASITQKIDFDTAALIASEFNVNAKKEEIVTEEDLLFNDLPDAPEQLKERAPVVVVMGHVDHGKTSLLDAIRSTNVTASEAGGITQHIGAYRVKVNGRDITFLDTPGHEAFTAMRARGAQVTDIAILVVAADDGIMPQTVEAINHAKAAGISIIVAINKIDKEGANPERVMQALTEHDLVPEEWGGDTICVPVSALKRQNIDTLLEMVLLLADMKELKANPDRLAKGTVIEAKLDKGRGTVATVLVQNGTLKIGDIVVAGTSIGHIRAMVDDKGRPVKKALPSVPVEILGLNEVPDGGDLFYVVEDERKARNVVEVRKQRIKDEQSKIKKVVSLDALFEQINEGQIKELNLIVKADVQGSVEAVRQSLEKLSNDEVRVKVIHGGVGAISESDVMLAAASNAIIIGFNVRHDAAVAESAQRQNVEIRLYRVIYNAIEDIEAAMKGMLEPEYKEVVLGHVEVRQIFKVSGVGTIGGCYVLDGKITRNSEVRLVRDGIVIHEGKLASLKRFKDDVKEVLSGYECGLGIENYNDIKEGDIIESFINEEIKR